MNETIFTPDTSRRRLLKSGGLLLAGGLAGCSSMSMAEPQAAEPPPAFPWPWPKLDPMEAGSRSYRLYLEAGG